MKTDKSIISGFFCASLTFLSFLLYVLQARFGMPYLFLSLKTAIFAAACLLFPLFVSTGEYKRKLANEAFNGKTGTTNIICGVLSGITFCFFAAFCYSGIVSLYESFTGKIIIFTSSVNPTAGEVIATVSLKGVLLPALSATFYYGALGGYFADKKHGVLMVAIYASLCEFSPESAVIALMLNVLASASMKKCGDKTIAPLIITLVYSLVNIVFPLITTLPFSYTLVTSPETAKYYGFVSAGIGLLFLAATVSIQLFFKGDNGEKPLLKITSDDRVSFFGTAALYAILTIVIYCGIV